MSLVNDLDTEVENFKREYEKFERGNKSAGTRARKVLQDIKKTCQEIRVSIQGAKKEEEKSSLPSANWQIRTFRGSKTSFFAFFWLNTQKNVWLMPVMKVYSHLGFDLSIWQTKKFNEYVFYDWRNVAVWP